MKKRINKTIVACLIVAMSLSMVACGTSANSSGDTSSAVEQKKESNGEMSSIITSDQWIDALGETNTYTFKEDGSGKFNSKVISWKLEGSYIIVSSDVYSDLVLSIDNTETGYRLTSDENQCIYVKAGELSSVQSAIREAAVESAIDVDLADLFSTAENNKAKAVQQYEGKLGKVVVNALNIEQNYFEYNTSLYGFTKSIMVFLPTATLAELTNGEQIQVVGQLANINSSGFSIINAFIIDDYVATASFTDDEVADAIKNFGDDGDGHISWVEGSFPFFIDNRLSFTLVEGTDADELLCSTKWNAKYYVQPELEITMTFKEDGSLIETEDGSENNWEWKNVGGLEFPADTGRYYEIRKVNDNTLVFYEDRTQYHPEWVLYK